jgi:hypothetical protein
MDGVTQITWHRNVRHETANKTAFAFAFICCMVGINKVGELVSADRPHVVVRTSQSFTTIAHQ